MKKYVLIILNFIAALKCNVLIDYNNKTLTKLINRPIYDYNEDYILFRKANDNEIKWLDKHLKEYGRMYFDKEKKELIEVD